MNEKLSSWVETLLSEDLFDMAVFNAVEREGDAAFDLVLRRIGYSAGVERARAMRLLMMLCRQFSSLRLPEAIRTAFAYATSLEPEVRSEVISSVIRGVHVFQLYRHLHGVRPGPPSRAEVEEAARRALEMGLDDEAEKTVKWFLDGRERSAEE